MHLHPSAYRHRLPERLHAHFQPGFSSPRSNGCCEGCRLVGAFVHWPYSDSINSVHHQLTIPKQADAEDSRPGTMLSARQMDASQRFSCQYLRTSQKTLWYAEPRFHQMSRRTAHTGLSDGGQGILRFDCAILRRGLSMIARYWEQTICRVHANWPFRLLFLLNHQLNSAVLTKT